MVAERGRQDPLSGTILLAIEEPELYQHPTQARTFAATLRALAEDPDQAVQAVYATRSPLFIEPGKFHQLRRLRRVNTKTRTQTTVVAAERHQVVEALKGIMNEAKALRQIDKACPQQLAEAVFADAVVLVEGETDKAVLDAVAERYGGVAAQNIAVIDAVWQGQLAVVRGDPWLPRNSCVACCGQRCRPPPRPDPSRRETLEASGGQSTSVESTAPQGHRVERGGLAFEWPARRRARRSRRLDCCSRR